LLDDEVLSVWATASEINSDYFEVERSADQRQWIVIGIVEAAGKSSKQLNYQHIDTEPLNGVSYYRLKAIDKDESFEYSHLEIVSIAVPQGNVKVYPNPNTGSFQIILSEISSVQSIEVYNSTGQIVRRITKDLSSELTIDGLSSGYYSLSVISANDRIVIPIIVSQ